MTTPAPVKILIVDDNPINLFALENVLNSPELELVRATSGNDALARLLETEFACILLDVNMPGMNGFEFAEIIRKDDQTKFIPIIFVSAQQASESVFKGYKTGAIDYLMKPLDPVILRSKVAIFAELFIHRKALERTKEVEDLNLNLEKLNQKLQSMNEDLSHFTQMAAHDLREPIRVQRNLVDLLREEVKDPTSASIPGILDRLELGLKKMVGMVDDFRALTGFDFKELKRVPVDLKQLIQERLEPYRDQIVARHVKIEFDEFPTEVSIYPSLASILYDNLIKNAFDHGSPDNWILRFTAENEVGKKKNEKIWTFGVMNTGSVIEKRQISEIFKMRRKFGFSASSGSGVGLTICKKVIERHDGTIKVQSEENKVHFRFTLEA